MDEPLHNASIGQRPALLEHAEFARLQPHFGEAHFSMAGEAFSGAAEFVLPVSGQAIIAFATSGARSDQDFGEDLVIQGRCSDGPFRLACPFVYVRHQKGRDRNESGWSLVSPVNAPARIDYQDRSTAVRVVVLLNNFDYEYGDGVEMNGGWTRIGTPFATVIGARSVTFSHTTTSADVRWLAAAGVIPSASLVQCAFSLGEDESDEDILGFGTDIAALCTLAAGGTVSVAMLTLVDANGKPVRRTIPQPVMSRYRRNEMIEDSRLPQFLESAYPSLVAMRTSHGPWRKLVSYCGCLQDPPYLEQKFASLLMAIEFVARNALVEHGQSEPAVARMDLPQLFGATRKHLGWNLPDHATRDTVRLWRNAVMHGMEWPAADNALFARLFNMWRLFLFRWVFIRLGYQGEVISPQNGWRSASPVNEFSEEHNSFKPMPPEAVNPLRELKKALKAMKTEAVTPESEISDNRPDT